MYVLSKPFVISDTEQVSIEPPHSRRFATDVVSVLIATSKDTTAELIMDKDEALSLGLIKEVSTGFVS